jgi:predicted permease
MVRTLWNLGSVNPGFDADHVLTANIGVSANDFATAEQQIAFTGELMRRLRALPGVQAAGATDSLPLQGGSTQPVAIEGQAAQDMSHQPEVAVRVVTPGFFDSMRTRVVRGRDFSEQDTASSLPVALVSESMARQFWPNDNPVGKRLTLTFFPGVVREVVGVVADVKDRGLDHDDPVSTLYWPVSQLFFPASMGKFHGFPMQLALRTASDPAAMGMTVRAALHELAPNIPLLEVRTMQAIVDESISPQRFNMFLLAAFAGLALLLAGIGLYSVLAYSVRQRARENGVRMALGARMRDVLRRVVIDGMKPTALGVGIGLAAALALSRVLGTLVFGVAAHDTATFAGVALLLLLVGLVASLLPAVRATRVDPLKVLREE